MWHTQTILADTNGQRRRKESFEKRAPSGHGKESVEGSRAVLLVRISCRLRGSNQMQVIHSSPNGSAATTTQLAVSLDF
jgi:hypothetical protein